MLTGPGRGREREIHKPMHGKCNGGLLATAWLWGVRREKSRMTTRDLSWVTGATKKGDTVRNRLGAM